MDLRLEQIQLRLQGAHWIVGYQKQDPKRPTFFFPVRSSGVRGLSKSNKVK